MPASPKRSSNGMFWLFKYSNILLIENSYPYQHFPISETFQEMKYFVACAENDFFLRYDSEGPYLPAVLQDALRERDDVDKGSTRNREICCYQNPPFTAICEGFSLLVLSK